MTAPAIPSEVAEYLAKKIHASRLPAAKNVLPTAEDVKAALLAGQITIVAVTNLAASYMAERILHALDDEDEAPAAV